MEQDQKHSSEYIWCTQQTTSPDRGDGKLSTLYASDTGDLDSEVRHWYPLSVDLVGPSVLFRGLMPIFLSFPEVVRARLLPVSPQSLTIPPSEPLPPLRVPFRSVVLLWHECVSVCHPVTDRERCAVLYDASTLADALPYVPLVALSIFDSPTTFRDGLLAASKGCSFRSPLLPESYLSAERQLSQAKPLPATASLSAREREIAIMAASSLTNEEIAASLFISRATVKTHLNRAFAKLNIHWRCQLSSALAEHCPINQSKPSEAVLAATLLPAENAKVIVQTKEGYIPMEAVESE